MPSITVNKNINMPFLPTFWNALYVSLAIILVSFFAVILFNNCHNVASNKEHKFDPQTAARASGEYGTYTFYDTTYTTYTAPSKILIDTTKPQPKVINHKYKLQGSDTLFQLLWNYVQSPIDVTPRNLEYLKQWIQSGIKQDTITIKK